MAACARVKILLMKYIVPRISDVLFLTVFISIMMMGSQMLSIDSDLGRHLVLGGFILETGKIPTTDILSYTNFGNVRPPYEWLSQVLFSIFYRVMNLDGVIYLTGIVIASSFVFVYLDATRRSQKPLLSALIIFFSAAASSIHWLPRPHIFSFLFLAVWLERLNRLNDNQEVPIWHFFLIMLSWANIHGGFIFGFLGWLAYMSGWIADVFIRKIRQNDKTGPKLLWIGILSLLASNITPNGWGNWLAVLGNSSYYVLQRTIETMPPTLKQAGLIPFWLLFFFSTVALFFYSNKMTGSNIFVLMGFGILGLLMGRNIPLFAISSAPILAAALGGNRTHIDRWNHIEFKIQNIDSTLVGMGWPILGAAGMLIYFYSNFAQYRSPINQFDETIFPIYAVQWVEENPQLGNMFNEFNWGGYLLLELWPEHKIFIDSQTDFYGEEFVKTYAALLASTPRWEQTLNEFDIEWIIIKPGTPLSTAVLSQPGWTIQYQDSTAVIIAKQIDPP